ncbi:uncharacterized protein LAESUDRAFT_732724 [Laetiporus sulphureus 93-53]|uniref:Uncharacterized protein n=1 Tax=Laetiporus sulphureus 93-53 TaxID=1314785 RepID=A0A165AZY8_9APHY|nr:uncharacterized protein LAESUDRAFT_732724 [Laetiporus sulphureus 93-53]KZS99970.1 hypothetical protein LAESUDRAFT_732724 [Laetiporus sulphureus 93-53]
MAVLSLKPETSQDGLAVLGQTGGTSSYEYGIVLATTARHSRFSEPITNLSSLVFLVGGCAELDDL